MSPCSGQLDGASSDRGDQGDVPRLLIIELVLPNDARPSMGKLLDLEMLSVTPDGRQRTVAQYEELLTRAGLDSTEIVAALPGAPASHVEAGRVRGWEPPR